MCTELKESDAVILMQCMKAFKASKSQAVFCTLCALPTPHLMCYKTLNCRCTQCQQAAPYAICPWRGKMRICLERKVVSLFETGEHQKNFAKQMAWAGMKPARIRTAMLLRFALRPSELPALQKVQNVACYYRRTKLGGSDTTDTIVAAIRAQAFNGGEEDHESFSFGWDLDSDGSLVVGNGSTRSRSSLAFQRKHSCAKLRESQSLSFFMWTQPTRQTRLATLSLFEASPMRQDLSICWRCSSLPSSKKATTQRLWQHCAGFTAKLWASSSKYGMGDADAAQYNALARVFIDCQFNHLMCYYHLIAKVVDRTNGLPKELGDAVLRDVYDMHYSRSSEALATIRAAAELRWQKTPLLQNFLAYFKRTWLNERFCRWQCFQTPPGFATTNNPVEQFNRAFKRDYNAHRQLKMGELLQQIAACCRQRSIDIRPFALCPSASKEAVGS